MKMLNHSPVYDPFTRKSILMACVTLVLDLSDYGTDIMVANLLRQETSTQVVHPTMISLNLAHGSYTH
jgi:hypothetical protein